MKKTKVNDIEIAYDIYGEGEPLLLVMGFSGLMELWPPAAIQKLYEKNTVIIFDNRGMGWSGSSDKKYSIDLFVEDTLGLLEALNLEQVNMLGYSMGTCILMELALKIPERFKKLILYAGHCGGQKAFMPDPEIYERLSDTSGTLEERIVRMNKLLFPEKWLADNPDPSKFFPPVTSPISLKNINRQFQALINWKGVADRLDEIKNKTLIITGTEDIITPPINSELLAKEIAYSKLEKLPGGHGLIWQYPEKFAQIVNNFMDESS